MGVRQFLTNIGRGLGLGTGSERAVLTPYAQKRLKERASGGGLDTIDALQKRDQRLGNMTKIK